MSYNAPYPGSTHPSGHHTYTETFYAPQNPPAGYSGPPPPGPGPQPGYYAADGTYHYYSHQGPPGQQQPMYYIQNPEQPRENGSEKGLMAGVLAALACCCCCLGCGM